ncbi:DUF4136 domain-containing protein [Aestuariibacter halophilus]|uniref:DUF4136 domain-containing protein n=1 Tax=Fluctibacter halophilus TaxID=226011 RepID=A0ABS8G7W0_9ALTE|nr:DUF4136 domain-containing protein [Aestuariibacter halophilus]MCC2616176.1 DUF4136 domain-containing protein [Aestuariibacter halophilus]
MRLVILVIVLLIQGCVVKVGDHTPRVKTIVSSFAATNASKLRTYQLVPSQQGVSEHDLQFLEFSKYIHRLMKLNGYTSANPEEIPQIVIFVGYGIGEPEESYSTYSMPILGATPTGNYSLITQSTSTGSTTYSNSTISQQTSLGITGFIPHVRKTVTYAKHLELYAVDVSAYLESSKIIPVWETKVVSTGRPWDLRNIFPYLVAASSKYLAKGSGKSVEVVVREDNLVKRYVEGLESSIPN